MLFDTSKKPYYIIGDGKRDNAEGFIKLQKDMIASKQHCIPLFESGDILSSYTKWLHRVRSHHCVGNDTTLRSLYKGDDEAQQRPIFVGEMMQNNVEKYIGTKEYVTADFIDSAKAGDRVITLKKPSEYKYKAGERIFIDGFDLFGSGYPFAALYFAWLRIDSVSGNKIYLQTALTQSFLDTWKYNKNISGGGAGTPRIFSLDRIENPYCDYAKFTGIAIGNSVEGKPGNFAYPAMRLIMQRFKVEGWLWTAECESIYGEDVQAGRVEIDRLINNLHFRRLKTPESLVNGGSINNSIVEDSETGILRLCSRNITLNNNKLWASAVIKDEQKKEYDYAVPCIADAPARNPIHRYSLNRQAFTSGAESTADKNLEFAPFEEIFVEVDGKDIILGPSEKKKAIELAATMQADITVLFNEAGTDGGLVTSISDYNDRYRVSGNWEQPLKGEKWLWCHVKEVIDHGGHQTLNGKSYGEQSIRWKGNTSTGAIKEMHLNQDDFIWPGNREIDLYGFITGYELYVTKPYLGVQAIVEIKNKDPYELVVSFDAKKMQAEQATVPLKWSKRLYLSTYKVIGAVTDDALPKFDIIIKWKPY